MLRQAMLTAVLMLAGATARAQEPVDHPTQTERPDYEQQPAYVEVIVTACPLSSGETSLEPINQGKSYQDEKPPTLAERLAALHAAGCIDVPIPPEIMTQDMTDNMCRGHAGPMAAFEFLKKRDDLKAFPLVGRIACMQSDHPFTGTANL